jgi:hypothetical protein
MAIVGSKLWHPPAWFERYVPDPDIEGKKPEGLLLPAEGGRASVGRRGRRLVGSARVCEVAAARDQGLPFGSGLLGRPG